MTPSLHPLLAGRWSPTRFDPTHEIAEDEIEVILEAARWAPSAGNSQPWAFIVARRGTADHTRLTRHLAGSSATWAPSASLLIANLSHRFVEDTDWVSKPRCGGRRGRARRSPAGGQAVSPRCDCPPLAAARALRAGLDRPALA